MWHAQHHPERYSSLLGLIGLAFLLYCRRQKSLVSGFVLFSSYKVEVGSQPRAVMTSPLLSGRVEESTVRADRIQKTNPAHRILSSYLGYQHIGANHRPFTWT